MSETKVWSAIEQMSGMINRYVQGDFDHFTYDEISFNIDTLKKIQDLYSDDDDMGVLLGLVKNIISHLYVARGYAAEDTPKNISYYHNMGDAKENFRSISKLK